MQYARLKKSGDFQKLFKKGKRAFSRQLTLIYSPAKGSNVMGVALSKKHGKAVKRNRIKRLIRAAFANNMDKLNGTYSVIIMPKVSEEYSYAEIEKSLITCFGRMEK
ncbi:MAG: ribonuclease P protein component [Clostridia bacterium]|nr:ribonuclease P protein component [Clostridia bacterium]